MSAGSSRVLQYTTVYQWESKRTVYCALDTIDAKTRELGSFLLFFISSSDRGTDKARPRWSSFSFSLCHLHSWNWINISPPLSLYIYLYIYYRDSTRPELDTSHEFVSFSFFLLLCVAMIYIFTPGPLFSFFSPGGLWENSRLACCALNIRAT
jgi:hypothetical protein